MDGIAKILLEGLLNFAAIIVAGVVSVRITAAILKTRIDGHDQRLAHHDKLHEQHFARFNRLPVEFMPREVSEIQFKTMNDRGERMEQHLQYLVFSKLPKPPEREEA